MTLFLGNQGTIAPELFKCHWKEIDTNFTGYTEKVDVYSLGVVFYWLVTGKPLFDIYTI